MDSVEPLVRLQVPLVVGLFKTARKADETDPGEWKTGAGFLSLDARSAIKNNKKPIFDYLQGTDGAATARGKDENNRVSRKIRQREAKAMMKNGR